MGKKAVNYFIHFIIRVVTIALCIITIGIIFVPYAPPQEYGFVSLLSLMAPGLLIANLIFLCYWLFKRNIMFIIPIIALAANYSYFNSIYRIYETDTEIPVSSQVFKVATLNTHRFNDEMTGYTAKQIASHMWADSVDVICFQEFVANETFDMDSISLAYSNYPYYHKADQKSLIIFSKYPITDSGELVFDSTNNGAIWCDISMRGRTLRLINAHLQTTSIAAAGREIAKYGSSDLFSGKAAVEKAIYGIQENNIIRQNQANQIRAVMDSTLTDIVLCGDFNDTPLSYTYHLLTKNMQDGFKLADNGSGYTYKGGGAKLWRIDYVLYSDNLKGIKYTCPEKEWSDHNPVVMTLAF